MIKLVIDKHESKFLYNECKDAKGNDSLMPLICPHTPPMFKPNGMSGKLEEKNRQCGNWCPLFEFVPSNTERNDMVNVYCGTGRKIPVEIMEDKGTPIKPIAQA